MSMKIKVLYITEPTSAGVGKHITDILANIDTKKFEVYLIYSLLRSDENFKENMLKLAERNITFHRIDMAREISICKDLNSLLKVIKYIRKLKPDIVHCHSSKAGFIGRIAATLCGVSVKIYSPHAFPFNNHIGKLKKYSYLFLEKLAGCFTTTLVATSDTEYKQAIDNSVVKKDKLTLIYNGINVEKYQMNKKLVENLCINNLLSKDTKVIGFISRLVPQKDPLTFVKAISEVKHENIISIICGDGELYQEIEEEIKKLNLTNKVILLGYKKDYIEVINNIDVFVLPSLWEGLPYILLETMLLGKVVIASNIVGNKDIVKDNSNGFLFEAKDYKQLAEIIDSIIDNSSNVKKIGINARDYIIENHSINNMVEMLQNLYQKKLLRRV